MNTMTTPQMRIGRLAGLLVLLTCVADQVRGQAVSTAGNGFYNIHVQSSGGNMGQYTITTGPQHPVGDGLNVLFGGGVPDTSYNTIHSYTTLTDYGQDGSTQLIGQYGTITALGTVGFRTTYTLPGPPTTPDALTIIQDTKVNGTTFSNSSVEVTTTIINNGSTSVQLGVRYLWDVRVGADDGPTFQQLNPSGPVRVAEAEFANPQFTAYRIEDNDVNPTSPTFNILGTVNGPATIIPTPTKPTLLQYAGWGGSAGTPFNYTIQTNTIAVTGDINNSAVLYYWGDNLANALLVPAGNSRKVSTSIFLAPPGFTFPGDVTLACQVKVPTPSASHPDCITRPARWWMEHVVGDSTDCVTLLRALELNGGGIDLGFMCLPTTYRNGDGTAGAADAAVEALGFFYRGLKVTGEDNGTQNRKLIGSKLCTERKRFASEMIAATANVVLLGTDPGTCLYNLNGTPTPFATNLLQAAAAVATEEDVDALRVMTSRLRRFNNLGETNQLPVAMVVCDAQKRKELRSAARDATTRTSCPGLNDSCDAAQIILHFPYKTSVNLTKYTDVFQSPTCGTGGADAIYKITPPVAADGRNFVIRTKGSNIPTLVSVWRGTDCGNLVEVACSDQTGGITPESYLQFQADGTSSYYIAVEGLNGLIGKIKLNITSF